MRSAFIITFLALLQVSFAQVSNRIITDIDLQSDVYYWSSDTTYILDGLVVLESGGELNIDAGTIIRARQVPGDGSATSALIIARGATIRAMGEYLNPIIFTAEQDDIEDPSDLLQTDRGLWGGVVILGDAPVLDQDSMLLEPEYGSMEDVRLLFGGSDPAHDAGTIKNVSIRHGGAEGFAGLTLAGCGSGTFVDYVESFAGASDGIRMIGGTVDTWHLSMSFNAGDAFQWDSGYRGRGQFWFAIQSADQAGYAINAMGSYSKPVIYNATLLGPGVESTVGTEVAVRFSNQSGGILGMSAIAQFPDFAIEVEDLSGEEDSYALLETGELDLVSNVWGEFGSQDADSTNIILVSDSASDPLAQVLQELIVAKNFVKTSVFTDVFRTPEAAMLPGAFYDEPFDPYFDAHLYPSDIFFFTQLGFFCYGRGAFMELEAWWIRHWTALHKDGFLQHPCIDDLRSSLSFDLGIPSSSDTIFMSCDQVNALSDVYYLCNNYKCNLLHQTLGVAMRMRRKRPSNSLGVPSEYCYEEKLVFQGYEIPWIDNPELDNIGHILDSFEYVITAFVSDSVPPTFDINPCDTCLDLPFKVVPQDCDTAWIIDVDHDTIVAEQRILHSWVATDLCGNISEMTLEEPIDGEIFTWYFDSDLDSYGNEDIRIDWSGSLPGYVNVPGDCDDSHPGVNPGNEEDMGDAIDNDCDGRGSINLCRIADTIPVSSICEPSFYGLDEATFDSLSQDFRCQGLFGDFIDAWLKVIVPTSGTLQFSLTPMDDDTTRTFFSSIRMSIYLGNCDQYETINCDSITYDGITHHVYANNLTPGDTALLHLINARNDRWPFSICAIDPNPVTHVLEVSDNMLIRGYPNPTSTQHFVEIQSLIYTNVQIDVLDMYGRTVQHPIVNSINPGIATIPVNIKSVAGLYVIRCRTRDAIYTYPVIVSD